ncbi:MAG: Gfo/Idh/MocA family protein [Promethearchaeota archaeon]
MSRIIKAGLLGAGWSANNIVKAVKNIKNLEIIGVYNHDAEKASKFARTHDIKIHSDNPEVLFNNEDIDMIIVSLPHFLHYPMTMKALEKNKHVLVEKPIAISAKNAEKMVETAKKKKLLLGTCFQNRFNDATINAKNLIEKGDLGKILQANISVLLKRDAPYFNDNSWRGTWSKEGGSALINQSIHFIDLMLYLLDTRPKKVAGFQDHLIHDIETEDNATAAFVLENDMIGTIQASISVKSQIGSTLIIHGSEKTMKVTQTAIEIHAPNEKTIKINFLEKMDIDLKSMKVLALERLLRNFSDAIINQGTPKATGDDGLAALKFVLKIYESTIKNKTR